MAARALADAGIVVLQVHDCPIRDSVEEAPCHVLGYDSAVAKLAQEGVIDPDRVGIVGFSRSCYYTLESLTRGKVHFAAASITDGVDGGYLQYLSSADSPMDVSRRVREAFIGVPPIADGLKLWFERAPGFNLDKVTAPVRIVAFSMRRLWGELEPYARLRLMKKPVDLIVVNVREHVLTNPTARMVSQGGTVDWFRFWLQGYEDPDPMKKDQYIRWRAMRKLQEAQKQQTSMNQMTLGSATEGPLAEDTQAK
jgi:hypothetical protein